MTVGTSARRPPTLVAGDVVRRGAGATFVDGSVNVGYTDTFGDLAAGAVGSLVAGLLLARRS